MLDIADAHLTATRSAVISMKTIGETAGASRALVYAYFPDQYRLLEAVLDRHIAALRAAGIESAATDGAILDRCIECADIYLRHIAANGMAIEVVLREASVARQLGGAASAFRAKIYRLLARAIAAELRMGAKEALTLVQLLAVIPGDAGRLVVEGALTLDEGIELNHRLLASSIAALRPTR
ncbi:TetR family transcriptional regulator [Sphingomonas sp. So64.6b]|uniref:TetR/AcrR family transcriptional regulator n=1 Tax=Sphingomonas sp. So64.6b TaxID=2997354 RepID=UPI0015FEE1EF|nr:TetR family transcriptional regulator [Sphingomonas sp. So64.6b]QNA86327.1 TetR family transcriptional regulator [Sphingomonas sp. So64.6b]